MFRRFLHFITYNNAFVLIVFALMSGAGVTLAANPEIRAEILDSHEEVRSVDNTYILSTDFSTFDPEMQIKSVTEDDEFYYVTYSYNTAEVREYVWEPFVKEGVLKVGKLQMQGRDLGLYVAKQLGEIVTSSIAFLKEVKESEETNGPTLKVITTAYSGLIGKMLDPVDKEFPGYVPVVEEIVPVVAAAGTSSDPAERIAREVSQALSGSSEGPVITLNGNNPASIAKGSSYIDLGAIATDDKDEIVTVEVVSNNVNTEVVGTYQVVYRSQDSDGNLARSVAREVRVYDSGFETIIAPPESATSTEESVPAPEASTSSEPKAESPAPEIKPKPSASPAPKVDPVVTEEPEEDPEPLPEPEPEEGPAPTPEPKEVLAPAQIPVEPTPAPTSTPVSTPPPTQAQTPASTSTPVATATSTPPTE